MLDVRRHNVSQHRVTKGVHATATALRRSGLPRVPKPWSPWRSTFRGTSPIGRSSNEVRVVSSDPACLQWPDIKCCLGESSIDSRYGRFYQRDCGVAPEYLTVLTKAVPFLEK